MGFLNFADVFYSCLFICYNLTVTRKIDIKLLANCSKQKSFKRVHTHTHTYMHTYIHTYMSFVNMYDQLTRQPIKFMKHVRLTTVMVVISATKKFYTTTKATT